MENVVAFNLNSRRLYPSAAVIVTFIGELIEIASGKDIQDVSVVTVA